jgi:hypothetical protein
MRTCGMTELSICLFAFPFLRDSQTASGWKLGLRSLLKATVPISSWLLTDPNMALSKSNLSVRCFHYNHRKSSFLDSQSCLSESTYSNSKTFSIALVERTKKNLPACFCPATIGQSFLRSIHMTGWDTFSEQIARIEKRWVSYSVVLEQMLPSSIL